MRPPAHLTRIAALLLCLAAALSACSRTPPLPPTETPAPHGLAQPFLDAWLGAGGASVGPPRSAPLWIDGKQVQLFERLIITATGADSAAAEPLAEGWEQRYPAAILGAAPSPQRATLALAEGQGAVAAPLRPLDIAVSAPGYSGPALLQLYDEGLRPAGSLELNLEEGQAVVSALPRGRLGPQWAALSIDGQLAGAQSALFTLDAATELETGQGDLDALFPRLRGFMEADLVSYELNGSVVRGYRSPDNPLLWLRDHVYQGRGFRYFERDVTSLLDAFRAAQGLDGSFPDVIDYPERYVTANRKETESDLEYLFVQGVYEAWQMSGDDAWLRENLPAMRSAMRFSTSDPLRWDAERGLVRRPYTIDTWDFAYGPTTVSPDGKLAPRHWIEPDTIWGTFHGDNTGLAQSLELLARAEERVGDPALAAEWRAQGKGIMERLNALSWNGRFFTHFVPEDPAFTPAGVDPSAQLSLSNAYALNRGVLDQRQGQRIVEEYFGRRDFERAFAEWYSIDPPFPSGSYGMAGGKGENPGEYVNGGIMPLVGGELARGAFRYGMEPYGFDILRRYATLTELTGASYLWYFPNGSPGIQGPDTLATDGWGAGAMIGALFEGAAGFNDRASCYSDLFLAPRWAADESFREVRAVARYAASDGYAAYRWQREERAIRLSLSSSAEQAYVRVLIPKAVAKQPLRVSLDGAAVPAQIDQSGETPYVSVPVSGGSAEISIEW
jgi:hypothetical protein